MFTYGRMVRQVRGDREGVFFLFVKVNDRSTV